jgi:hypothetical protein
VGGYLIFAIPISSRYLKSLETKNCQLWVFKCFQNQKIAGFGYLEKKIRFKNLPVLGISKTSKNHQVS